MAAELQGSGDAVRAFTGGAGRISTTKGLTSISPRFVTYRRGNGEGRTSAEPRRVSEDGYAAGRGPVGRRAFAWQRNDDAPEWCTRRCIGGFDPLPL